MFATSSVAGGQSIQSLVLSPVGWGQVPAPALRRLRDSAAHRLGIPWCLPWRHTCQDGHASKRSNSLMIPQVLPSSQSTSFSSLARFFSSQMSILAGTWQALRKHCDPLCAGISTQERQSTVQILLPLHPGFTQQKALGCSSSSLTSWPSQGRVQRRSVG